MYHVYANADPHLAPYYRRASRWRSRYVNMLLHRAARAANRLWARVLCRRRLRRAMFELNGLSDAALKDIGIARSEIGARVVAAQKRPCRRGENRIGNTRRRPAPAIPTPRYVSGWNAQPPHAAAVLSS